MLIISNAFKSFGNADVLKDINLSVDSNSIVGLAGYSGSGKSTLLRVIQGLESLDSGSINRPHSIGFMFQDFQLFPHTNVFNNLCYAPKIHLKNKSNMNCYESKEDIETEAFKLLEIL